MEAKDVGNRIKELREERKMTQYALANQSGVSPTYVYQLERGEKKPYRGVFRAYLLEIRHYAYRLF